MANEWNSHVEELSKNPRVDIEKVRKITYLYEFDRYALCLNEYPGAKPITENSKAQLGAILLKGHTIAMHPPVTRCWRSEYLFSQYTQRMTRYAFQHNYCQGYTLISNR